LPGNFYFIGIYSVETLDKSGFLGFGLKKGRTGRLKGLGESGQEHKPEGI